MNKSALSALYVITALVAVALLLVLYVLLFNRGIVDTSTKGEKLQEETVQQMMDPVTGEVNEAVFEAQQEVSTSDDMSTISSELDETLILEEDFSDLDM